MNSSDEPTLRRNDEPTLRDGLGHYDLVTRIAKNIIACEPPYVIAVGGAWGTGKTSFLRKLWALMGGEFTDFDIELGKQLENLSEAELIDARLTQCIKWFGEEYEERSKWHGTALVENVKAKGKAKPRERHGFKYWRVVWFNPWQHQFESSPLVALLHEIRAQFDLTRKAFESAAKFADLSIHATFSMLGDLGKTLSLGVPLPNVDTNAIRKRGQEYEAERFSAPLTSQRFRELFEQAVSLVVDDSREQKLKGRLLILIDDLDRCEGQVAYRFLESLKLYLNARNCVYVLGMDQSHLEPNIATFLARGDNNGRILAREYLGKMLQSQFHLPVPGDMRHYLKQQLKAQFRDDEFVKLLRTRFDWDTGSGLPDDVIDTLNDNLPHNPRKVKLFLAGWKTKLTLLDKQLPTNAELDWRLTVILNYFAQFEEPIFRRVEESPDFYNNELLKYVAKGQSQHPLIDGMLDFPYGESTSDDLDEARAPPSSDPRVFWISRLMRQVGKVLGDEIRNHLVDSRYAPPGKTFLEKLSDDAANHNIRRQT